MKAVKFINTVSAISNSYLAGQTYTLPDDEADDMVKAGHAIVPVADSKPVIPAPSKN